ncbi:hypothetical protein KUTeg_023846 [Tegillarca granosa]|uniref:VWFA domain-containing protein n=1 Tax=Tegillarca granosa TaxID=220873 RepID=A0ABQ9E7N5_TEGGR|nr:hypothetical protein KUTeg_023846 [Tegillarca granosa]
MFTLKKWVRGYATNTAILITDSLSNRNSESTISEVELARSKNIQIYTIGFGLIDTANTPKGMIVDWIQ